MNFDLPVEIAKDYSSPVQHIRVMTEGWANRRTKVLPQFVEVR